MREKLFKATDLAAFCQVDLKTIHNWFDKGSLTGFRTPGGHLRFKPEDVRAFLDRFGYPVPAELADVQPAQPTPAAGPRAHVTDVFEDGAITLTFSPADLPAIRAMAGRDVVLSIAPATGSAAA